MDKSKSLEKSKPKRSLKSASDSVVRWFREMRSELKKVVWPTRKQLVRNCMVAIAMMVVCGIVFGAFDLLAQAVVFRFLIGTLGTLLTGGAVAPVAT
ncbi:MAG: preprotein translocase subunit SecE [Oscillospiraceae bacterium]|jgi:preprotein translocase subunit SecE|nr:preprotein translocase subunit SecE [Oscillospiraceae bacterium]